MARHGSLLGCVTTTLLYPKATMKGGKTVDFPDPVPVFTTIVLCLSSIALYCSKYVTIGRVNVRKSLTIVLIDVIRAITYFD